MKPAIAALVMILAAPFGYADDPDDLPGGRVPIQAQVPEEAQKAQAAAAAGHSAAAAELLVTARQTMWAITAFGIAFAILGAVMAYKNLLTERAMQFQISLAVMVVGTYLVIAGYSAAQMAPITGIMGLMVGYLLGAMKSPAQPTPPAPPAS